MSDNELLIHVCAVVMHGSVYKFGMTGSCLILFFKWQYEVKVHQQSVKN